MPLNKFWSLLTGMALALGLFCHSSRAEEEPVGRGRAAAIAQSAFGGKVLSVDEQEGPEVETSEPGVELAPVSPAPGAAAVRYTVKLLQTGGRIKVIKLDVSGNIL